MGIDSFWWFVGAVAICGLHAFHLRCARHERLQHMAWWEQYNAQAQDRHEKTMRAIDVMDAQGEDDWNLDGNRHRGQA